MNDNKSKQVTFGNVEFRKYFGGKCSCIAESTDKRCERNSYVQIINNGVSELYCKSHAKESWIREAERWG